MDAHRPASRATVSTSHSVGEGMYRHLDPHLGPMPLRASHCIIKALQEIPLSGAASSFQVHWRANRRRGRPRRTLRIALPAGCDLYGLGEHAGPLRRNGKRVTLWNADHYAYDDKTQSLYQSHPWVMGVRRDGSCFGILWDTPARSRAAVSDGTLIVHVEDAGFPVYTIEGDSPESVLTTLTHLIGRISLPPLWALGYHQSRYSYYPDTEVRRIADEMRLRRIPCDVIWLDIHYMNGNRSFTFDPERFPDPRSLISHLHDRSLRVVLMIDPGLKVDPEYHAYASGNEQGMFVSTSTGDEYHGQVWPGACAFPDFSQSRVREWWGSLYAPLIELGADGFWNDMNEPAIFDGPGRTMPEDNVHLADPELGGPTTHARLHNVYGTLMVRATREGVERLRPDSRPFILTRSGFLGTHRHAATWTGDNSSMWEHLGWSITMALNLGLSGQPLVGPDIGGFEGNASGKLFARWMGVGSLLPFCRAHTDVWTKEHEPWSWGPAVEATCRRAIMRRYRLLPYLYTLARESADSGLPIVRPLFFADPTDPALRSADDSFLLGASLLVRCAVTEDGPCLSPVPAGDWTRFDVIESADPELPELHLREGHILPAGPAMQHSGERTTDPLTLFIHHDQGGNASGSLYEDAGDGHEHARGEYRLTRFESTRGSDAIQVSMRITAGEWEQQPRTLRLVAFITGEPRTCEVRCDNARDQSWSIPLDRFS
ncbi:MAG: DUF5110 domain-containing protein [Phycisphaeraceae bacterium]|nr:DUF5110 domain-containing protein [Phycisphaeraceae bacterium]